MDRFRSSRFCRFIRRGLAAISGMNNTSSSAGTTSRGPIRSGSGSSAYRAIATSTAQAAGSRGSPARFF